MKYIITLLLFAALPFLSYPSSSSHIYSGSMLMAQEEELMEEPEEKPAEKKEAPQQEQQIQETKENGENGMELKEQFDEEIPESRRYLKDKYELVFDAPFETVWNAVKKCLENISCMIAQQKYSQTDEGLFKGNIKSDYCVLSLGDSTFTAMKKYSLDFPIIRGGDWKNGRIQHTYIIKETEDHKVTLLLRSELSGFEDYVTHEVHFWKSNGILETRMLEMIKKELAGLSGGN